MGAGFVGTLTVDLHLPESASLKDKRRQLLRVKAGLTRRFACAVAEVDHHDRLRRARLTLAVVTREAGEAERQVDAAARWLHGDLTLEVLGESRELVAVADEPDWETGGRD
jgi:uncharacterized protein YlxP (DUF503 family)